METGKHTSERGLQQRLAQTWASMDDARLVNAATRKLMSEAGEWDPPHGVAPLREPIRMAIGIPDSATLPVNDLQDAISRVLARDSDAPFVYGFGAGYARLRASLAERYRVAHGDALDPDSFQLCNGSSGAIDLICRCLIDPGDVIIAESPTYMGTLRNFRAVQAEIESVPMDAEGILIPELTNAIDQVQAAGKRIRFIYTISTFHNPTGITQSHARREALLELAARKGVLVLDDTAYSELYFGAPPPPPLASIAGGVGVLTVGSLSKILATGLRLGWVQGPTSLIALLGKMRFAMGLNQLMVRAIHEYMEDGRLDRHVESMRHLYNRKMTDFADALHRYDKVGLRFDRPAGGFYLWIDTGRLPAIEIWRMAMHEGVAVTPGSNFFTARVADRFLRIAYPWTPHDQLEEGARRFARACERVAAGERI